MSATTSNGTAGKVSGGTATTLPTFAPIDALDFDQRAQSARNTDNVGVSIAYKAGYVDEDGVARTYTAETWSRAVIANMTRAINDKGWGGSFIVYMSDGKSDALTPYVATNVRFLRYNPAEPHNAAIECTLRGENGNVFVLTGDKALSPLAFRKLRIRNRGYVAPMPSI